MILTTARPLPLEGDSLSLEIQEGILTLTLYKDEKVVMGTSYVFCEGCKFSISGITLTVPGELI